MLDLEKHIGRMIGIDGICFDQKFYIYTVQIKHMRPILFIFVVLILSCSKQESNPTSQINTVTLSVSANEGGSVNSQGGTFSEGTSITLTAIPLNGYRFNRWSNGSTENPITITLSEDVGLTAIFEVIPKDLFLSDNLIEQVNSKVGKWNVKRRKRLANQSKNSGMYTRLFFTSGTATNTTSSNTATIEEIENLMGPYVEQIENLMGQEAEIYDEINSLYQSINQDLLNRSDDINQLSTLFDNAETIHNEAIELKDQVISVSKSYINSATIVPEQVYEKSNELMDRVYVAINGLSNESITSLDYIKEITARAIEVFVVTNEDELRLAIDEYNSVYDQINRYNTQLDDLLYNRIYPSLFDVPWIIDYTSLSDYQKIQDFQQKLNEINAKLIEVQGFDVEAKAIGQSVEDYILGLQYNTSKNKARMEFTRKETIHEANYRYSTQNALKLELFYRYISARVGYLIGPEGELRQQYTAVFELTPGREALFQDFCQLVTILQNMINGFPEIEAEYNQLLPEFNYVGESYENWEPYDQQYDIFYDFDVLIQSEQSELDIRIQECNNINP